MNLLEKFLSEPRRFSFFQAVMLLEAHRKGCSPVGHQGPPDQEAVRFHSDPSLAFPKSDVSAIEPVVGENAPPFRLTAAFMGLYGTTSPLPSFYSEWVIVDQQEGGPLREFFDLFNHRLLSFYYRAWAKYRAYVLFRPMGRDEFSERLFCLAGLGTKGLKEALGFPAVRALRFLGFLTQKPHSAESLVRLVQGYFHLPARVEQFVSSKINLEESQQALLGKQNCQLGENLVVGLRVPDRMGKFLVSVGPVDYDDYRRFLPGRENLEALKRIARFFSPDGLDFEVEVVLRGAETPRLGLKLAADSYLGWTTGIYPKAGADIAVVF